MKYLVFADRELIPGIPELVSPGFTACQECFTPNIAGILRQMGDVPADTFDEMVVQLDAAEMRDFGKVSESRPEIVDEAPGLVCLKCNREGVAA